jgi:hypothetical protein
MYCSVQPASTGSGTRCSLPSGVFDVRLAKFLFYFKNGLDTFRRNIERFAETEEQGRILLVDDDDVDFVTRSPGRIHHGRLGHGTTRSATGVLSPVRPATVIG